MAAPKHEKAPGPGKGGARSGAGRPPRSRVRPLETTTLGWRLATLRKAAGFQTAADLAREAGLTPQAVQQLESGVIKSPAGKTLTAVTEALVRHLSKDQIPPASASDAARILGYLLGF